MLILKQNIPKIAKFLAIYSDYQQKKANMIIFMTITFSFKETTIPKSPSLYCSGVCRVRNIFSGFTSIWTSSCLCKCSNAFNMSIKTSQTYERRIKTACYRTEN